MRILALESSAKAASCAVTEDGRLAAQYFQSCGLTHSRTLMPMVRDILENSGLTLEDIDLIAVAKGPGSFTGVRIGVSTVKGLAWGSDKPVCGVSTLEAMAYQIPMEGVVICPVMDARRGQVYTASFTATEQGIERLCADRAISLEELEEDVKASRLGYLFVGDGAELSHDYFTKRGYDTAIAPENLRLQTAYGVACAAVFVPRTSADELVPVYLRLSQAERERLEKLK